MDSRNTRSQERKINIRSTPSLSELGSTHGLNTLSQNHGNNIPSTSKGSPSQPTNLACADLLNGSREEYIKICVPLYEASVTGDWQAAKVILDKRPELVRFAITKFHDTALHVAASGEDTKLMESFVENLVDRMEKVDLEIKNVDFDTALCVAAATGSAKMAMTMVNKNKALLNIPGNYGMLPLSASALHGNHDMGEYLYDASEKMAGEFWTDQDRSWVLCNCVKAGIFDIAQKILIDHPELATYKFNCWFVLDALARKPSAFNRKKSFYTNASQDGTSCAPDKGYEALALLKTMLDITTKVPQVDIGDIHREDGTNINRSKVLSVAAEMGNTRFVIELIQAYPDLLWKVSSKGSQTQEEGIDQNSPTKCIRSIYTNATRVTVVQEVEKMLPPIMREMKNKDGRTPYELFSENNQNLVSHSLKWMRDCMVVATLIVTVAFAVGFTVPGGYNQETGIPIFIGGSSFIVFVIADAISLFSSTTSLLVFLSILTSHYRQRDFLYSLPRKLMIGLVTLFIFVAAMMITFSASFFVLYRNGLKWVPILIGIFAALPVIIFAALQFLFWWICFALCMIRGTSLSPRSVCFTNQTPYSNHFPCFLQ